MPVIGHEYGHAIENRMIGKGVGHARDARGRMGEAFGDFDALEYLNAFHYAPVPGSDPWTEGAYVTGNHYNGIRDYLASEPMGGDFPEPGANPKVLAQPRRLRLRQRRAGGARRRRDLGRGQYDIRDLMLDRYPAEASSSTSPVLAGGLPPTSARGTGAGSSSTTTRWS